MKKNGFTLVELIAVIVIISILVLISTPVVTKYINNAIGTSDASTLGAVEDAALDYAMYHNLFISNDCGINYIVDNNHPINLPSGCTKVTVKVSELKGEGFYKDDATLLKEDGEVLIYKYKLSASSKGSYELRAFASTDLLN